MSRKNAKIERYQIALEETRAEATLSWQIFGTFLLANTVFFGFLLQAILSEACVDTRRCEIPAIIAGFFGIFLCILWWGTTVRTTSYYDFRIAQARKYEPRGWGFLRKRGQLFAEGQPIKIEDHTFQIGWIGKKIRTRNAGYLMIAGFVAIYIGIAVVNIIKLFQSG